MNPNVTEVDIYSIRELTQVPMGSVTPGWLCTITDPGPGANGGQTYKLTYEQMASIISGVIGSGIVEPDRFYVGGQPGPIDPATGQPVNVPADGNTVNDSYLNGKAFSLELRGVGFLRKGIEWDNDVPGGGWRLLGLAKIYQDAVFAVHFQPAISNIISTPDAIGKFVAGIQLIASDTLITADMFRKLLVLTNGCRVTLAADYPENIVCPFTVNSPNNRQSTVIAPAGQSIAWNGGNVQQVWLGKNEDANLVRAGDTWYVLPGSTMSIGYRFSTQLIPGRLIGPNQILAAGQLILRSDFPRVLDRLNQMNAAYPGSVVSAEDWENDKSRWGFGDGVNTIQVPQLLGRFLRWLDMGAGLDADRIAAGLQNIPGTGQGMQVQLHNHTNLNANRILEFTGQGTETNYDPAQPGSSEPDLSFSRTLTAFGGSETRPINGAELPIINL